MKIRISKQEVSFEESFLNIDIAKACAMYNLDQNGIELTKENIEDETEKYLNTISYNSENPNYFKSNLRVITLKCNQSKNEIGFAVIDSYEEFENLTFIYINKELRRLGNAEKLLDYFIKQSKRLKIVQATEIDIKNTGTLLNRYGFNYRTSLFFNFNCMVREEDLTELFVIQSAKQANLIMEKKKRFESSKLEMMTIFNDVRYGKEINPIVKLSKILERFPHEEIDFLKVLQSEYKETEYFYLVIDTIIELYQEN